MHARGRWTASLAVAAALATGVGACGGSSAPSKAAFTKEANGICASFEAKLKALPAPTSTKTAATYLQQAASLGQQETSKLAALKRPSGNTTDFSSALRLQSAQVVVIRQDATKIGSDSVSAAQALLNKISNSSGAVNQDFDAAGATTCGSGS